MTPEDQKPATPAANAEAGEPEAVAADVNRLVRERYEKAARLAESGSESFSK